MAQNAACVPLALRRLTAGVDALLVELSCFVLKLLSKAEVARWMRVYHLSHFLSEMSFACPAYALLHKWGL